MAAPVIAWSGEFTSAAYPISGAYGVNIPTSALPTWSAGDVCLVWVATDGDNTAYSAGQPRWVLDDPYFSIGGSTWTEYSNGTASYGALFYRRCTGQENSPTVDYLLLQWNENEPGYVVIMQITGCDRDFPLVLGVVGGTTNAQPGVGYAGVAALKETRDVLYLAFAAWDHNDTYVSSPANYTAVQNGNSGSGSGDCGGAVAQRTLTGSAEEDPLYFTISGSEEWVTATVAVLGDCFPVVAENNSIGTVALTLGFGVTDGGAVKQIWSFVPRESCSVEKVSVFCGKVGTPTDDVQLTLRTTYNGAAVATSGAVDVQGSAWYTFTFPTPYAITAGTTYWVCAERTGTQSGTNYYSLGTSYSQKVPWTDWEFRGGSTYVEYALYVPLFQVRKVTVPRIGMAPKVAP